MAVEFSGDKSMNAGLDFHSDDQNWSSSDSMFHGFGASDLGTPIGSELDSTETESDDDEFMADLTRRMSDYMLEDEHEDFPSITHNLKTSRGREKSESAQWFRPTQHLNLIDSSKSGGSGLKAVYLGSGESRRGSTGTGVFLPRVSNSVAFQPTAGKKTSRCSTVLIPARVLQLLEQHFNNAGPNANSNVTVGPDDVCKQLQKRHLEKQTTIKCDNEIQLPQEWTY